MTIIKGLCYISIAIAFLASGFLLIWGVMALITDDPLSNILVTAGISSFLVAITSAYPVFALGIAEEKISKLEKEVNELQENIKDNNRVINQITVTNSAHSLFAPARNSVSKASESHKNPSYEEAVSFLNKKHNLSVLLTDDLATIKEKVETIDDGGFTAIIFKRKVSEATTKDEIESIFVMHAEEYD